MKIVINACYGQFSLSYAAMKRYAELSAFKLVVIGNCDPILEGPDRVLSETEIDKAFFISYYKNNYVVSNPQNNLLCMKHLDRLDLKLIQVIEELGSEKASGPFAELKVVEIPDNIEYLIVDHQGLEHIAEKHRIWR